MSHSSGDTSFAVVSPIDGRKVAERALATPTEVARRLETARVAQREWQNSPLRERQRICRRAARSLSAERSELAHELTLQMGRPITHGPSEADGVVERTLSLAGMADTSLAPIVPPALPGFERFIERVPVGVVLAITPWNYPYLTAINSLVPALLAGNAVLLKPSPQVPLCAERLERAFLGAGLPAGLLQVLHASPESTRRLIQSPDGPDAIVFTGSVRTGHLVQEAAAARFAGVSLELGGKDPAYVREDADLERAVAGIVEGALFNAGQSCCAVERIYVHESCYTRFVEAAIEEARSYRLGDPRDPDTRLGPLVNPEAARRVRGQIDLAVRAGARSCLGPARNTDSSLRETYVAAELLTEVDHDMTIMREETFGPVLPVMRVASDAAALELMNDSDYGLSASIWTRDLDAARTMGDELQTGTVFVNRCDYLDPALAWTGVKNSGRGCALSQLGFGTFVRAKSFHLRR